MSATQCSSKGGFCYREQSSTDPVSPGKIGGAEKICRGGYTPHNFQKETGLPKENIVREKDLFTGALSVWRLGGPHPFGVDDVVGLLEGGGPKDNILWRIFAPRAQDIRATAGENIRGEFCVVDDTDCGPGKERHPAHAVIALC